MNNIRVLVVDDQPIVRRGLIFAINQEPGMEVIGEAEGSNEAVEKASEYSPDVVLMDLKLPDMSGIVAIERILVKRPDARVLVFSAYNEDELVFQAIEAGATGYILKGSRLEEIFESIRAVHSGEEVIGPAVAKSLVNGALTRGRAGLGPDDLLSKRELEVLRLTSDGCTLQDIAEKLGLRPSTVKTYNQRIMGKLDLHSKNELFKYAVRNNLVEVE